MTQEEKAKAYDEVMGRAKKELDACGSQDCDAARQIFRLFPELKESEDERIRKEIIYHIQYCDDTTDEVAEKRMIAWLEKQGEQKPQRIISAEAKEAMYNKPAWSEEDEDRLNSCVDAINAVYKWDSMIAWLKSLKDRYTWKPSDEQILAIETAINVVGKGTLGGKHLIGLLEQLRKQL